MVQGETRQGLGGLRAALRRLAGSKMRTVSSRFTVSCALAVATLAAACSGGAALKPQVVYDVQDQKGRPIGVLPPGVGIAPGQAAPATHAHSPQGQPVELAPLYAKGPLLLVFYRGGWCPFAQVQIRSLVAAMAELQGRGVQVAVVSVDAPADDQKNKLGIADPMLILHDRDLAAHTAFGVVHEADAAEVKTLRDRGIAVDADQHGVAHFAVPSVFLIQRGVVTWAHAEPELRNPPVFDDLRPVLDKAGLPLR